MKTKPFKTAENQFSLPDQEGEESLLIRIDKQEIHRFISGQYASLIPSQESPLGKAISNAGYWPELTQTLHKIINEGLNSKQPLSQECIVTTDTNNTMWLKINCFPEPASRLKSKQLTIFIQNITSFKLEEEQLEEFSEQLNMLSEASDYGIWDWIPSTNQVYFSRKWKQQLGYYPDEIENKFDSWLKLVHPNDYDRLKLELDNFRTDTALIYETEYRMRHKDGQFRWTLSRGYALRNSQGEITRMMGIKRDINEEKETHEKVKIFKQAIDQNNAPISITDTEGHILYCNPAFAKITGYTVEEAIGKSMNILKSGTHPQSFYQRLWETIKSGKEWKGEIRNRTKNGTLIWELTYISPIKNEQGTITHYIRIAEEIGAIKHLEDNLRKAKTKLEINGENKSNFLANISHEIRTPVNGIMGFSELLKDENLTIEQRRHFIHIIEENSKSLLLLIDDVIDISQLESNHLKIHKEACILTDFFNDIRSFYEQMRQSLEKDDIQLIFRFPKTEHHQCIFTDSFRLRQILNNFFANALKYTDHGKIEIGYQILNDKKLQFYVEDTGKGIAKELLPTIFNRHVQKEHSKKEKLGGSGLGLSIARGLVQLLGGTIGVKSTLGKGSLFFFTLPYDKVNFPTPKKEVEPAAKPSFSESTILIAEDIDYNFEYLREIISPTGAKILWAKDGIDALNLFKKNHIDLVLMDIQLPELNGHEATKAMRKIDASIPIIAQTAYAMDEDSVKCKQAGCNEVLTKPIKIDQLLQTLKRYLKK